MRAIVAMTMMAALVATQPAWAQMGSQMLRNSTRIIERTISRNLDRVFRPHLVVREGATGPVTAMALSGDERFLVSAVGDRSVRLWDLGVGRELGRLAGHDGRVDAVAVSPNGKRLATGSEDRTVRLWNMTKVSEDGMLAGFAQPVSAVAFLDDDRLVAADASGAITLNGAKLPAHGAGPVRLAVLAGGGFASGGADGAVRLWDAKGGAGGVIEVGAPVLALVSDGKTLAAGLGDGRVVRIDPAAIQVTERLAGHGGAATAVAFGRDGTLYSGGQDGKVLAWRAGAATVLGKHDGAITFVGASRDGDFAMSAGQDGTTRLWNTDTRQLLLTLLSTTGGWAVVDAKGRYDGNQTALNGIDWQADDSAVGIESFAETHFEAALLPRVLGKDTLAETKSIPDGVRYPAKVRFISPTVSGDAANPTVQVEVEASDDGGSGVAEVRLYRNGRQVNTQAAQFRRETDENGAARVVARFDLDLGAGRNVLSATAVNEDRMESPAQNVVLTANPPPPSRPPLVHLMTVGINTYANKALNLFYARADSRSIGGFFGSEGLLTEPLGGTIVIEDGKATKDNILAALTELRKLPAQDMVVVYMAGHGVSLGEDWFFVPHEVRDAEREDAMRAGGLSSKELKAAIESLTAERTLLLLDTCHSGSAVSTLKDYRGMKSLRLLARSVGTHILAATDRSQFAIELARLGHGVFTYALLEGLKGKADRAPADGTVSAAEIIGYVEEKVPALAAQYTEYAQYPTGYSRGTDFGVSRVRTKP